MSDTKKIGLMGRDLPIARLLPNMITMLALCSGLTGIRFALQDKWAEAAICIVIAAIFDVLDGRVARLLGIASKFGAELDSLSDSISFGVAPALILYLWAMQQDISGFGWIAALGFASCSALRLARFNTMLEDHDAPAWTKSFFTGVPAPAGAGLALLPLFYVLQFGEQLTLPPVVLALWILFVGGLMISRVPTMAMKNRKVAPIFVAPMMVAASLYVAALITNPWLTLSATGSLYFITIPLGMLSYRKRQNLDRKGA